MKEVIKTWRIPWNVVVLLAVASAILIWAVDKIAAPVATAQTLESPGSYSQQVSAAPQKN